MKDNAMSKAQTDVVAALRIELDATKAALARADALDLSRAEEIQRLNTMLGDTAAQRDEARAERDALTKQVEAERHLHDALGSTLRIRSLESERDALTKQVADLKARLKAAAGCIQRDELGSQVNWPDRLDAALNLKLKSWRKGGK